MAATEPPPGQSASHRTVPILGLEPAALKALSDEMKLSLSEDDMVAAQAYFRDVGRDPTDVELEVIAQTWSEHCKHRIFGASIEHALDGVDETVDGLFKTYIRGVTERIRERKPGFVLAAFDDNAGFVTLDEDKAACFKVETHNHPSAIEPYAGANTGIGGVIRDILGAGKGARPIGSVDVFCFGRPDTAAEEIRGEDVIHPVGILRGVVRGVRDYGNRMGIPTVCGAIQFDDAYLYNPLVYCGTAGIIPIKDIHKEVRAGMRVFAVGGRTGRDGLKGATFSSASLHQDSHAEDQQAVQIGNPIEEKKAADFVLTAREHGLIEFVTDCGAGGFSSAVGEMLEECGGHVYLERCPLKEPGLSSWEIFLSESQERMVLAVKDESVPELKRIAEVFESELVEIGVADGSGILKVTHHGEMVCELDCPKLHDAPRRHMRSEWTNAPTRSDHTWDESDLGGDLRRILADFAICSRAPIIREYDHEVQGNTLLKPLAGAEGDAPQDAAVLGVDGSDQAISMGLSILPEWGKFDPHAMGKACVDETVRQIVLAGAHPDKVSLLDNFCLGNPEESVELGGLVETVKGMAEAAEEFGAPFVSGKDSFNNYFETDEGPVTIPTTLLSSGIGIVDDRAHVTGSSLRRDDSVICLLGLTAGAMGGSVHARRKGVGDAPVPTTDCPAALESYRAFHGERCAGRILSAHDCSEGGLAVAVAEMAFSLMGGIDVDLDAVPGGAGAPRTPSSGERRAIHAEGARGDISASSSRAAAAPPGQSPNTYDAGNLASTVLLFSESSSRFVLEVRGDDLDAVRDAFKGHPFAVIGKANPSRRLTIRRGDVVLVDDDLVELKAIWKSGLTRYY